MQYIYNRGRFGIPSLKDYQSGRKFKLKNANNNLKLKFNKDGACFYLKNNPIVEGVFSVTDLPDENIHCQILNKKQSMNTFVDINTKTGVSTPVYKHKISNWFGTQKSYLVDVEDKLYLFNKHSLNSRKTDMTIYMDDFIKLTRSKVSEFAYPVSVEDKNSKKYALLKEDGELLTPFVFDGKNIECTMSSPNPQKVLDKTIFAFKQGENHILVSKGKVFDNLSVDLDYDIVDCDEREYVIISSYDAKTDKTILNTYISKDIAKNISTENPYVKVASEEYNGRVLSVTDLNYDNYLDKLLVVEKIVDDVAKCGIVNQNNVEVVPIIYDKIEYSNKNKNERILKKADELFYLNIQTGEIIDENKKQEERNKMNEKLKIVQTEKQKKEEAYQKWLKETITCEVYDNMTDSTDIVRTTRKKLLEQELKQYKQQALGTDGTGFDRHFTVNYKNENPEEKYRKQFEKQYNVSQMGDDN